MFHVHADFFDLPVAHLEHVVLAAFFQERFFVKTQRIRNRFQRDVHPRKHPRLNEAIRILDEDFRREIPVIAVAGRDDALDDAGEFLPVQRIHRDCHGHLFPNLRDVRFRDFDFNIHAVNVNDVINHRASARHFV